MSVAAFGLSCNENSALQLKRLQRNEWARRVRMVTDENKDCVTNRKRFLVQKLGRLCEVNVVCQIEDQDSLNQTLTDGVLAMQIIFLY